MYSRKTRPEFQKSPAQSPEIRFAIVGNPRTGSSHLVSMLDSHPQIACWDEEIFDIDGAFNKSAYNDPRDFLFEQVFKINAQVVGFKFLWDAICFVSGSWAMLSELGIWLIHTYRSNLLDNFISMQLATINKAYTSWHGDYKVQRFNANYDECLSWFDTLEHNDEEIKRCAAQEGLPRLEIEYNELCRNQDRVLDFLNVSRQLLTSKLKKQRKGSQAEIIINYQELKDQFAGSRWAKHFEE